MRQYVLGMQKSSRKRWGFVLLGLASAYFLLVYLLPGFGGSTQGATVSAPCTQRQQQSIAKGRSPSGSRWSIAARISNDGSCRNWLLDMDFVPSGGRRGRWTVGWGIPADGHLSSGFTIGALDEASVSERVFMGVVGARVRSVIVTNSKGDRLKIHPKLPSAPLRKRLGWLRNMRYFIRYYPRGQHARVVKLLDADGRVIYAARGEEGEFTGPI